MGISNVPLELFFYQKNTQVFEISGLKDQTGAYLDSATMVATLVDQNGAQVPGFVNIPMTYVAASQGVYQGTITSIFNPTAGPGYILMVDASQGAAVGHWEFRVKVTIRRN